MSVHSKVLKVHNLPKTGKKIGQVNAKPYLFIIVCLFLGICLLYTSCYLLGVMIVMLFSYNLLFVRDMVLAEFYDEYAVFYLDQNKDECYLLFWDDIEQWGITKHKRTLDTLDIILKDQKCISFKCLHKRKIEKFFESYVASLQMKR